MIEAGALLISARPSTVQCAGRWDRRGLAELRCVLSGADRRTQQSDGTGASCGQRALLGLDELDPSCKGRKSSSWVRLAGLRLNGEYLCHPTSPAAASAPGIQP